MDILKYSDIALKLLVLTALKIIKSKAVFWKHQPNPIEIDDTFMQNNIPTDIINKWKNYLVENDISLTCVYDEDFPVINPYVKKHSEKPYLFLYKGDISLLSKLNNNVAVIGLIDTTDEIIKREKQVVKHLVQNELVIVSGLAKGCDTIAHKTCLEYQGKTVAILPTELNNIYPKENQQLAEEIIKQGGLLLSEYFHEPKSKQEAINRFIERDRLQAMFAKAVILIASYRYREGDSGSRHAIEYAKSYHIDRFVMYNQQTDHDNPRFGLNHDLINNEEEQVKLLTPKTIEYIKIVQHPFLQAKKLHFEQPTLF